MNLFDRRLRAFSIDTAFAAVMVMILVGLTFIPPEVRGYLAIAVYFIVFCVPYLFGNGQTFGKRIQKIKVVWNTSELDYTKCEVPNRFYLILRDFTKCLMILITFGLYVIIGAIVATGRKDGRSIHDLLFRTKVIAITKYVSDGVELNRTESASNSLKGYGPRD